MEESKQKELDDLIIGVIESAHEDSLSDDPQIAMVGRARKASLEPILRWITAEEERGSDYRDVILAFCYLAGGIAAKIAVGCRDGASHEHGIPNNEKMIEVFSDSLRTEAVHAVEQIAEHTF